MDKNVNKSVNEQEEKNGVAAASGPCCWLGLCCPPEQQIKALAEKMTGDLGWNKNQPGHRDKDTDDLALSVAAWILDNFDLAPKGSLQVFKDAIRDYAREGYAKVEVATKTDKHPGIHNDD